MPSPSADDIGVPVDRLGDSFEKPGLAFPADCSTTGNAEAGTSEESGCYSPARNSTKRAKAEPEHGVVRAHRSSR